MCVDASSMADAGNSRLVVECGSSVKADLGISVVNTLAVSCDVEGCRPGSSCWVCVTVHLMWCAELIESLIHVVSVMLVRWGCSRSCILKNAHN